MKNTYIDRRSFLTGASSLLGGLACSATPALGALRSRAQEDGDGPTLVLLQLSGGNDGLSTVVPYGDDGYGRARSTTRLQKRDLFALDDYRGLNGKLANLHGEWQEGRLAIIEGVGYDGGMIRSHFRALEVWHTGRYGGRVASEGWVSGLAQAAFPTTERAELVVHLGRYAPYSVYSSSRPAASLESPTGYQWFGDSPEQETYAMCGAELGEGGETPGKGHVGRDRALARLRGVLDDARDSSLRIRRAAAEYKPLAAYPRTPLGATLRDVAAMIHGKLGSRLFSVAQGGFDTHASQRGTHDDLMATVDGALGAFLEDLSFSTEGRDTIVVVFSEFGRRVEENASRGTDHGAAGPMFIAGANVRGGLYGAHPSLTELERGDLVWTTDFRSAYAALIENGFGVAHERVLGERYPMLDFLG